MTNEKADRSIENFLDKMREPKKIKIISCEKTSDCGPTQWEGITSCKRFLYIRYRGGCFYVNVSKRQDRYDDNILLGINFYDDKKQTKKKNDTIYVGYGLHSTMTTERMIELTKDTLDFSECNFISRKEEKPKSQPPESV